MKRLKRILPAMLTAVVLVAASLGFSVSASSADNEGKPKSVVIHPRGTISLTKGKSRDLTYTIRPDDAYIDTDVYWYSEDSSVVEVDSYSGTITAIESGVTWIHIRTANGKADSIEVKVPGRYQSGPDEDTSSSRQDTDPRYSVDYADDEDIPIQKISTAQLVEAIKAAGSGAITVRNYTSVSCASLADVLYDTDKPISFDTLYANGAVQGRVTINPKDAVNKVGDIKTAVYTSSARTETVRSTFTRYYSNKVNVIRCLQNQYGMTVTVAAKVGSIDIGNLHFYSYSRTDNRVTDLSVSNVKLDNNGYLHFDTTTGGYIIVSQGALVRR